MYFVKETEGVCVVTYGQSRDFPAFFSPKSGCQAPYNINQPEDAANMIGNTYTLMKQKSLYFLSSYFSWVEVKW